MTAAFGDDDLGGSFVDVSPRDHFDRGPGLAQKRVAEACAWRSSEAPSSMGPTPRTFARHPGLKGGWAQGLTW